MSKNGNKNKEKSLISSDNSVKNKSNINSKYNNIEKSLISGNNNLNKYNKDKDKEIEKNNISDINQDPFPDQNIVGYDFFPDENDMENDIDLTGIKQNINNIDNPNSMIKDLGDFIEESKCNKTNSIRKSIEENKNANSITINNGEKKNENSIRSNNQGCGKYNDSEDFHKNFGNKQIKSDLSNNNKKNNSKLFLRNSQELDNYSKISKNNSSSKEIFNHTRSKNIELKSINEQKLDSLKNNNLPINKQKNDFDDKNSERQSDDKEIQGNQINICFLEDKINRINEKDEFTIIEKNPLEKENNFFSYFFEYFRKREIFFIAFLNQNNNTTPTFIRRTLFMLILSIIFIINCFFFDKSLIHNRYLNAKNDKFNNFSYFFKKEFKISIYTALISDVIKMVFIKIIINWIFKITNKEIKMKSHSFEQGLNKEEELKNLNIKRAKYLKNYFSKIKIYCFLIFTINIFIAYICICYVAVFPNSYSFFIISFISSYIMSFIFCMLLCLFIIVIYKIWKKTNNLIAIAAYILLSRIY